MSSASTREIPGAARLLAARNALVRTLVALLGDRGVVVTGSVGAGRRLPEPAPDTSEGAPDGVTGGSPALLDAAEVRAALPDAVLHSSGPGDPAPVGLEDLTARVAALPGVVVTIADEASGAPEAAWGNRFFFAGADRRMPFATIVDTDVPGWDELSRLHRPGVHRLNVQLGRREFERRFGFPPARLEEQRDRFDFARFDVLLPHPLYGGQGWGCILNPTPRSLPTIDALLAQAHEKATRRDRARQSRADGSP
jgi:hypothetical protein